MTDREIPVGEDILAMAMAYYREPMRYRNLLSARVVRDEGVQILLRAAIGTGPGVSRESRSAALFAIEQLFFTQDANHYQILGLASDAKVGQVKLHHRLLMRLLHPDRSDARQTWMDAYAGRVNQAYNVLRKPASRRAYDHTLRTTQHDRIPSQVHWDCGKNPPMLQRLESERPSSFQHHAPGLIKHLPQLVLSAVAVLALLFVFWSYRANRTFFVAVKTEVTLADNDRVFAPLPDFERPFGEAGPHPPERDLNQRRLEPSLGKSSNTETRKAPMVSAAGEEGETGGELEPQVVPAVAVEKPERAPRELRSRSRVVVHGTDKQEVALPPKQNAQAIDMAIIERQARQLQIRNREAKPPEAKKAQATPRGQNQEEVGVSVHALKALMGCFVETYNRGDLAGFMTLFEAGARTSSHYGKSAIREDYQGFFSTTASRRLTLKGLQWRREGTVASGRGRFQVRIKMRGEGMVHDSRGTIRFEVRKRKGALKIRGVYHEMN